MLVRKRITSGQVEDEAEFVHITENQVGIHPAFTNQHQLNLYLLGKVSSFIDSSDTYMVAGYVDSGYVN